MPKEWKNQNRTVTMTNDQWGSIGFCIQQYAKEVRVQLNVWKETAADILPDGKPSFEDADLMVKYWSDQLAELETLLAEIEPGIPLFLDVPRQN